MLLPVGSYLIRARSFGDMGGGDVGVPLFVGRTDSMSVDVFTLPRGFNMVVRDMQLVQLAANRARWDASAVRSYNADISIECFCFGSGSGPVEVRDGSPIQRGGVPASGGHSAALTIDMVFDMLDRMIREPSTQTAVQYDPVLGFPVSIHSDMLGLADASVRVQVRNLKRIR
ncbi:MAG: DUF6174 domain-containing protein [Gemmatimonadota bacterium]